MPVEADVATQDLQPSLVAADLERILSSAREELRVNMTPEAKLKVNLNELFSYPISRIKTLSLNLDKNKSEDQILEIFLEAKKTFAMDWVRKSAPETTKSFLEYIKDVMTQTSNTAILLNRYIKTVSGEEKEKAKLKLKKIGEFSKKLGIIKKQLSPPDPILITGVSILGVALLGLVIKGLMGKK